MAERGARMARMLTNLAFGAIAAVLLLVLASNIHPRLASLLYLGNAGLIVAALAPVLALTSVVMGLAAGIGWPLRSAIALILGIVVSFWPLIWWLWLSNCPGHC